MAEHEPSVGASDEWYTPPEIFAALDLTFDLDPCSPGEGHWVPARAIFTKADDGLSRKWDGLTFMNPPFGGRNGHVPWLHDFAVKAETMVFPRGKTKFIRPDGSIGKAPGHGVVLLGMGRRANAALHDCGLGLYVEPRS